MTRRIKLVLIEDGSCDIWHTPSPKDSHKYIKTAWFDIPDIPEMPKGDILQNPDVEFCDEEEGNTIINIGHRKTVVLQPFDWKAFIDKWGHDVDRDSLSEEQHREFIRDYYDACESLFPREKFKSNSEDHERFDGQAFDCRTYKRGEYETITAQNPLEIPVWDVVMNDGTHLQAEAEEIFLFPTDENKTAACDDITSSFLKNFDEVSGKTDDSPVFLYLDAYNIPLEKYLPDSSEGEFIVQISTTLKNAENRCGLKLDFSNSYEFPEEDYPEDDYEITRSVPLGELPFDLLQLLRIIAKNNNGRHRYNCDYYLKDLSEIHNLDPFTARERDILSGLLENEMSNIRIDISERRRVDSNNRMIAEQENKLQELNTILQKVK